METHRRSSQRSGELDARDLGVTSILRKQQQLAVVDEDATLDDKTLGALGYKQEFKRDFTFLESFSVSFSILGLLPSVASTISYSLGYAGTGGLLWGWIIPALCIQATGFSMAELCSSMPTAGGLYYAAAVLAPEGWGPMASWFVGWSNLIGFVTNPCSVNYALASMLVTCAQIAYESYEARPWHLYVIMLGLLLIQGLITMQSTKFIGQVNKVGLVTNVVILLIFVIWFPVGSINRPKTNKSSEIWTSFTNGTEWPIAWSTIMGFLTATWTMSGYDAAFHLSEECANANIAAPRAIASTVVSGFFGGFAIILVIAYTVQDITQVVAGPYSQPFGSLCLQVLGKKAGLAIFALNIAGQFFIGVGCTIASTRILFAYSRDGAIFGSRFWARVDKRTRTPVLATWAVVFFGALLGLLLFASPYAINAVFSIGAIGQYTAFTFPVALKLVFDWNGKRFRKGPWHLGRFSKPINMVAVAFWLLLLPALCFPVAKGSNLTLLSMNWTALIYGGPLLLAMLYYMVSARKWFKGPKINVEHTNVVDGQTAESSEQDIAIEWSSTDKQREDTSR